MRSPKVLSRSEVWKGSNLTWSRTHHRSFKYTPQYADHFQGCIFISSCKTMNILFNYNFKIYRCQFACRFNSSAKVFIVSVFTVLIPTWDSHEQLLPQGPLNQASYFSLIYKGSGFKPQCLKQSQNCYQVKVVFFQFCSFTNTIPIY